MYFSGLAVGNLRKLLHPIIILLPEYEEALLLACTLVDSKFFIKLLILYIATEHRCYKRPLFKFKELVSIHLELCFHVKSLCQIVLLAVFFYFTYSLLQTVCIAVEDDR